MKPGGSSFCNLSCHPMFIGRKAVVWLEGNPPHTERPLRSFPGRSLVHNIDSAGAGGLHSIFLKAFLDSATQFPANPKLLVRASLDQHQVLSFTVANPIDSGYVNVAD